MAAVFGTGPVTWRLEQDDSGFRTYRIGYRVKAAVTETPAAVMQASGLPVIGSLFDLTGYTGTDLWCWCRPEMSVRIDQEKQGDPAVFYMVEKVFSNKWESGKSRRCNNTPIEDPLLEPMKISGSFNKIQFEAKYNKDGNRLITSANEPITGSGATWDYVRPTVRITQNSASLGLSTFASMVNTVNSYPLWGLPARCIKLANVPWERSVYGSCNFFYTRTFEFEIDDYNQDKNGNPIGFDRELYDSGSMCLRGQWITQAKLKNGLVNPIYGSYKILCDTTSTDPTTILNEPQSSFMAFKDMNNEKTKVFLDGYGRPANVNILDKTEAILGVSGAPASKICQYYRASDFLILGIPTSF